MRGGRTAASATTSPPPVSTSSADRTSRSRRGEQARIPPRRSLLGGATREPAEVPPADVDRGGLRDEVLVRAHHPESRSQHRPGVCAPPVWHDRPVSARAETRPPTDPTSGPWRLARVAGLGIAAYGLAVGAHVSAGGGRPGWPVSVMLIALLGVLGVAFTTRRRRLPALLGALTAAQAALHVLLSLLDAPASSCSLVAVGHHVATAPAIPRSRRPARWRWPCRACRCSSPTWPPRL